MWALPGCGLRKSSGHGVLPPSLLFFKQAFYGGEGHLTGGEERTTQGRSEEEEEGGKPPERHGTRRGRRPGNSQDAGFREPPSQDWWGQGDTASRGHGCCGPRCPAEAAGGLGRGADLRELWLPAAGTVSGQF